KLNAYPIINIFSDILNQFTAIPVFPVALFLSNKTIFNFYCLLMRTLLFSLACILSLSVSAQKNPPDSLMTIIETELKREMKAFEKAALPPYYIAYRITDSQNGGIVSSFGSLIHSSSNRSRYLSTEVRVGDYSF